MSELVRYDEAADTYPASAGTRQRQPPVVGRATSWWVLVLACAGQFMVVLDVSVINVALPSIQVALDIDPASLQWVSHGYTLVFAGFLLLGGRLADLYGCKRVFSTGLALFSAASLAGGLADAPGMLIAARAVQGLGAAVLAPATLTILTTTFPEGPRRTRALATWTAMSVVGGAAGNLVGGVLTQYLSWRAILLINVPIGAVALLLAARFLTAKHARGHRRRLDVPGAVLATVGLASLTYGITQAQDRGISTPVTVVALTAGTAALISFVVVEARFAPAPLMPLRLFRVRAVSVGNVVMLLAGAGFQVPMWYFLTLYMQHVLGYTALQTGLGFLPHAVVTVLAVRLTPRIMRHADSRTLIIVGAAVAAAGFWWQSHITPDSGYVPAILGPAVVICVGGGLLNTPITTTVTSGISTSDAGAASGLMNTTKQAGGALGLAVLVAIVGSHLHTPRALAAGYSSAFLVMAMILLVAAALALALPAGRDGPALPKLPWAAK